MSAQPIKPGTICAPCWQNNQLETPAIQIINRTPVCRRCANKERALHPHAPVAVPAPQPEPQALAPAEHLVPLHRPAVAAPQGPQLLSREQYRAQFGPSSDEDLLDMVQSLEPEQVIIIPGAFGKLAKYKKLLKETGARVLFNKTHSHVVIEARRDKLPNRRDQVDVPAAAAAVPPGPELLPPIPAPEEVVEKIDNPIETADAKAGDQ